MHLLGKMIQNLHDMPQVTEESKYVSIREREEAPNMGDPTPQGKK